MRKLILSAVLLGLGSATAFAAPTHTQVQTTQPAQHKAFIGEVQTLPVAQLQNNGAAQDCAIGPAWVHTGRMPWRAGQRGW